MPLLLASIYLPPRSSKYALRTRQALEDYFGGLADESAAAAAVHGGADVLWGGDFNAHSGTEQEGGDFASILQAALSEEAADEILAPCTQLGAEAAPAPPRASCCQAPVCEQGRALLACCAATGMLILNGRLPGDLHGGPTCFCSSERPALINYFVGSAGLLARAASLRVLPLLPESPFGHAPFSSGARWSSS